jgi:hypothetical protein
MIDSKSRPLVVMSKTYSGESIIDVESDVSDSINYSNIPKDEYGFHRGTFEITILWMDEEK